MLMMLMPLLVVPLLDGWRWHLLRVRGLGGQQKNGMLGRNERQTIHPVKVGDRSVCGAIWGSPRCGKNCTKDTQSPSARSATFIVD